MKPLLLKKEFFFTKPPSNWKEFTIPQEDLQEVLPTSCEHSYLPERPSSAPDPAKPPCSLIESFQAKGRTYSIKTAKVNLLAKETNKIPIREEEREYFQLITKCWIIYASAVV